MEFFKFQNKHNKTLFFYKNIDVTPRFVVILYSQQTFILTNEITREITQRV